MAYTAYQNSDNIVPYYQEIVADKLSDVETLPTDGAPGSCCIVLEDSSVWVLGNDTKWHKV